MGNALTLPSLDCEAQVTVITAVLKDAISKTINVVEDDGITVNGVTYGVTWPCVVEACIQIGKAYQIMIASADDDEVADGVLVPETEQLRAGKVN